MTAVIPFFSVMHQLLQSYVLADESQRSVFAYQSACDPLRISRVQKIRGKVRVYHRTHRTVYPRIYKIVKTGNRILRHCLRSEIVYDKKLAVKICIRAPCILVP